MTYYREEWNLYVAHFLMKETLKDDFGLVLGVSYYISVELFQYENPEVAYEDIIKKTQGSFSKNKYRHEGNIIEEECIGLNDLDLLQTNMDKIKEDFAKEKGYGIVMSTIRFKQLEGNPTLGIKTKEQLGLFDEYYNYKKPK